MNKLKLGLDIDSVVCELIPTVLERINRKNGTKYTKEYITDWYKEDDNFELYEEVMSLLEDRKALLNLPSVLGANPAIRFIKEEFELHFITARPSKFKQDTKTWILNNLPLRRSEFILHHVEKDKNGIGVDILVDDNFGNVYKFASSGKPTILYTQPWNTPKALADAKAKYPKAKVWSIDNPDSHYFGGYPIHRAYGWFQTCNLIFEAAAIYYDR